MKSMRAVEAGAEFLLAGQRGWNLYHSISKDINIVDNRALQQFHLSKSVYLLTQAVKKNSCLMSYVAQRAEKQSCGCHRGYVEVEFESCGYKKEKEKSQEWELKASFLSLSLSTSFLIFFLPGGKQ